MRMVQLALFIALGLQTVSLAQGGPSKPKPPPAGFEKDVAAAGAEYEAAAAKYQAAAKKARELSSAAGKDVTAYQTSLTAAEKAANEADTTFESYAKKQKDLNKRIESLTSNTGMAYNLGLGKGYAPTKEAIAEATKLKAELASIEAQVAAATKLKAKADADAATARISSGTARSSQSEADAEAEKNESNARVQADTAKRNREQLAESIRLLDAEVRGAKLGTKESDLKNKVKDAALQNSVIENALNGSLYANMMKTKMEGLLLDPAFCKFSQACGNPGANSGKPDLSRLFSSVERDRKNAPAKAPENPSGASDKPSH